MLSETQFKGFAPPKKNSWQVKQGANGSWLVKTDSGNEKTSHGEAQALMLWSVAKKRKQ